MEFQISFVSDCELIDFSNYIPLGCLEKLILSKLPITEYWSAQKLANKIGKKNNSYLRASLSRLKQNNLIIHDTKQGYKNKLTS